MGTKNVYEGGSPSCWGVRRGGEARPPVSCPATGRGLRAKVC